MEGRFISLGLGCGNEKGGNEGKHGKDNPPDGSSDGGRSVRPRVTIIDEHLSGPPVLYDLVDSSSPKEAVGGKEGR